MKKLGVFLGFQPGSNLSTEGIGRLLAFILKEQKSNNFGIVLFCPEWLVGSVKSLLKDNKVPLEKCEIVSTQSIPIGVKIKNYLINRRTGTKKISPFKRILLKLKQSVYEVLEKLFVEFMSTSSWLLLFSKSILYLLIGLIMSPIILSFLVIFFLYKSVSLIAKKGLRRVKNISFVHSLFENADSFSGKMRGRFYHIVLDNELNRIVKLINSRKEVKVCFIPSMAWPQVKSIQCSKVLAAPDILFYDFPTQYSDTITAHKRIRKSIDSADHLICYSNHVKYGHLIDKCGVDESKVTVIKHANINMREHLKLSVSVSKYLTDVQNAKLIINSYIQSKYSPNNVWFNSNISQIDYVIYSSQARPHKNIFNLIKAIKIINMEKYKNIKLIVTGDISNLEYMQDYIKENHLENDIFVMGGLSSEVLAAFNKMAVCAVNPTLFEGGFPFTFSEAYSVGTPSVMSSIPVVEAEIESIELRDLMLFDPYNPYSMAQKIEYAMEHKDELYKAQAGLYEKFAQRDWKLVVGEYNAVFEKFMS
ncbi:hypothetical protein BBD42_01930 [Paenibacillus sp. BIHB 4019]|uniref:Glycosyl transferase family 1 domain-containing protein n=1 Tax=Paenibacillus sp. BIHB 4019 TaxID=1870819 RepID=A0A1B2DCD4_9BACL|nr:glycosyltransferase [Paenibacillus sp. BIHB 4019]ANY65366.1 hypothetical protein BBD42_01930 [Paenibacillus sp. BIHB 4019]